MSLLIVRKKREEEFPLFDYRRLFFSCNFDTRPQVVSHFPKHDFVIHPIDCLELFGRLRVRPISRKVGIDDSESRVAIWRALFKDRPLPTIEENAVEKYAGSLNKYLPENVPIDKVVKHAKKG